LKKRKRQKRKGREGELSAAASQKQRVSETETHRHTHREKRKKQGQHSKWCLNELESGSGSLVQALRAPSGGGHLGELLGLLKTGWPNENGNGLNLFLYRFLALRPCEWACCVGVRRGKSKNELIKKVQS
jgi:hypothetical protein